MTHELAWAAGFLENTGTFTNSSKGAPRYYAATTRPDRYPAYQRFATAVNLEMRPTSIGYGIQANSDAVHQLVDLLRPWLTPERIADADYVVLRQHLNQ